MIISDRTFRRYIKKARDLFPVYMKVIVRREALTGDYTAVVEFHEKTVIKNGPHRDEEDSNFSYCKIVIEKNICRQATIDCILHEWTHMVLLDEGYEKWDYHDDVYWKKFGEHYRAWHEVDK